MDDEVDEVPRGRREGMPREQAEALALRWRDARSAKDYATADAIRTQLRAVGVEAEDLAQEIEFFGLSAGHAERGGGAARDTSAAPTPYEPDPNDPLAYRDHSI